MITDLMNGNEWKSVRLLHAVVFVTMVVLVHVIPTVPSDPICFRGPSSVL